MAVCLRSKTLEPVSIPRSSLRRQCISYKWMKARRSASWARVAAAKAWRALAPGLNPEPPAKLQRSGALQGRDLLKMSPEEMRHVRGAQIAMVFQDHDEPQSVLTIGAAYRGAGIAHGHEQAAVRDRAAELLTWSASRRQRPASTTTRTNFPAGCASV